MAKWRERFIRCSMRISHYTECYQTESRSFEFLNLSKSFAEGGTMICQSERCPGVALIPAGFRKAPTLNTMDPIKYSLGGLSALMALAHVIIVPKTIRIYNASPSKYPIYHSFPRWRNWDPRPSKIDLWHCK